MCCLDHKRECRSSRWSRFSYHITLYTACEWSSHCDNLLVFECLSTARKHVYFQSLLIFVDRTFGDSLTIHSLITSLSFNVNAIVILLPRDSWYWRSLYFLAMKMTPSLFHMVRTFSHVPNCLTRYSLWFQSFSLFSFFFLFFLNRVMRQEEIRLRKSRIKLTESCRGKILDLN